ncbi:hypothetical protein GIB67_035801 [Kingdonia uniflora]|uniref:Squalene monooxygenase n=1 Tax=Kingdonia uniflora TaxID=39325 RepID=A0A7J7MJT7_9MAGN|nr:hypothetical protein GIB67_035801 [Kingdonia uniflora]
MSDVAAVSVGNNYEVGQMIAKAMSKGYNFDRGYISPYFVTYSEKVTVEFENCKAFATLVINKHRGVLKIDALKAPRFGERKSQYLDDIAILTGVTVIREEVGQCLDKAEKEVLGHAAKVVFTKEVTTIFGNGSTQDVVNKSFSDLKSYREQDYEKEKLNERIAKLSGGVVVIQSCFNNGDLKLEKMGTDDIIVGAGVVGAALGHTLGKDGHRVHVIERDLTEPDRIVGELLQPGGYLKLIVLGLEDCVDEIDAQRFIGYALFKDGKNAKLSYPLEKFDYDVSGRSFHNGCFIEQYRLLLTEKWLTTLRTTVASQVPPQLYDSFIVTIYKGSIKIMQNRSMPADPHPTPGALLIGDAFNMSHPLTGGGMTVALSDIAVLHDLLKPLRDLNDASSLCRYLESFYILRKVEAQTEIELKEKKLRVEDALNATKASVKEGIVVGGGCTLLRLAAKVRADIVYRALSYPLKLSIVMEKYGYNAATGKYEDLMAAGIINPTKMSRNGHCFAKTHTSFGNSFILA